LRIFSLYNLLKKFIISSSSEFFADEQHPILSIFLLFLNFVKILNKNYLIKFFKQRHIIFKKIKILLDIRKNSINYINNFY
jgi:hypothetical protein